MVALKGRHISKCPRKKYIIWVTALKNWRLPTRTQLIIFLDFLAEILRIAHLVNYSYLPPWIQNHFGSIKNLLVLQISLNYFEGFIIKNPSLNLLKRFWKIEQVLYWTKHGSVSNFGFLLFWIFSWNLFLVPYNFSYVRLPSTYAPNRVSFLRAKMSKKTKKKTFGVLFVLLHLLCGGKKMNQRKNENS